MESIRRLRLLATASAVVVTAVLALVALLFDQTIALGFGLGSLGGVAAFWLIAVRAEQIALAPPGVPSPSQAFWTLIRFVLYAAVMYVAYTLDREGLVGLVSAVAGLFVIRFVLIFLALTGLDIKSQGKR